MGGGASAGEVEKNRELLEELDRLVHKQRHLMKVAFANAERGSSSAAAARRQTTEEEVASRKIPRGCVAYIWKQDPSVKRVGVRKVFLPHEVLQGPKDDLIEVVLQFNTSSGALEKDFKASAVAVPDENCDFLEDIDGDPFAFDLVHTYAVARMTLDMYIRDLKIDWRWQWDRNKPPGAAKTPLRIIAHAGEKPNAVYHRGKRVLKFYYFTHDAQTTYLCRSYDIVAHETGHAILDALKPALYSVHSGQAGALHESFADLTAIFSVLSHLDICEDVIAETKSDLRKANYVTAIGEQFADAMSGSVGGATTAVGGGEKEGEEEERQEVAGMRNANNTIRGSESGTDLYRLANVFTGYVWDILVNIFNWERNPQITESDAETLHRVSRIVRRILLLALFNSGDMPDFVELSYSMEKATEVVCYDDVGDEKKYKEFIVRGRRERELELAGKPKKRAPVDLGHF